MPGVWVSARKCGFIISPMPILRDIPSCASWASRAARQPPLPENLRRGALIEHAGADKTTLARLSSLLEQSEGEEGRRGKRHAATLRRGMRWPRKRRCSKPCLPNARRNCARRWCEGVSGLAGVKDDLAERLAALASSPTARVSVWAERPLPLALSIARTVRQAAQVGVELPEREDERQLEPVITLPAATSPVLAALSPLLPDEATTTTPPVVPLQEPEWEPRTRCGQSCRSRLWTQRAYRAGTGPESTTSPRRIPGNASAAHTCLRA